MPPKKAPPRPERKETTIQADPKEEERGILIL